MDRNRSAYLRARAEIERVLEAEGLKEYAFIAPSPEEESESVRSIVVVLFPYLAENYDPHANLSRYCRGMDYHKVVPKYLNPAGEAAKAVLGECFSYQAWADTGPFRDRLLALRAGLGLIGRSQMLINKRYGTWFFIGYLTMNMPLHEMRAFYEPAKDDAAIPEKKSEEAYLQVSCLDCGRCRKACPGGVIKEDGTYDWPKCRSGITQEKGELSPQELEIFYKDNLIFGCDLCQEVCPYNKNAEASTLPEFTQDRIDYLTLSDVEGLSRREFLEKYPDRAFTWRGPKVLVRNLLLQEERRGNDTSKS
ncbi:MAG: DUF1730 domain-containing protein [Firmicutes bacterium]|nr:DUF1730 domain-containing protein [Bacillota bacterium]